jgi:hypothetical protein
MSESDGSGFFEGTPSERMEMMWAMPYEAFALMGYAMDAPLRRVIARLFRPEDLTD